MTILGYLPQISAGSEYSNFIRLQMVYQINGVSIPAQL